MTAAAEPFYSDAGGHHTAPAADTASHLFTLIVIQAPPMPALTTAGAASQPFNLQLLSLTAAEQTAGTAYLQYSSDLTHDRIN